MRVLLVAADAQFGATLARGLLHENIDVTIEQSVVAAKVRALRERFDTVVVDADLPGGGGELSRALRRLGTGVSTIMLIERDSIADRIRARAAEADAYLMKPVATRDLLAELRARAAARLADPRPEHVTVADMTIDVRSRGVYRGGRRIDLTPKEFVLLEILARHAGTLVDRGTIAAYVWGGGVYAGGNVLEVLVRRLRRKIDDGQEVKLIQTHRGRGYRLLNDSVVRASAGATDTATN